MTEPLRRRVRVELGRHAYDVVCGPGLMAEAGAHLAEFAPNGRLAVVADETVAGHYKADFSAALSQAGVRTDWILVPPGEASKSWSELERVCDGLLALRLERGECVVALGGGVVGDLAGLAAALVKRGAPYVQIPTTLLAQVDSSVGGKTAINAPEGKNLIGAFHQPVLVLADTIALDTLDPRDLRAGYAEVVKYAVIADPEFFAWLTEHGAAVLAGDAEVRLEAVARCVAWKARIVAQDEREAGQRALLNLGHTFGHAFEAIAGYDGALLHGEGVAAGMVAAAEYAERIGFAEPGTAAPLARHLAEAGLPARLNTLPGGPYAATAVLEAMFHDKKAAGGKLRLVLPRRLGECHIVAEDDPDRLLRFLEERL